MRQKDYKTTSTVLTQIAKDDEFDDYKYIIEVLVEADHPCVIKDFLCGRDVKYVNNAEPSDIRKVLNILADFGIVDIYKFPDRSISYEMVNLKSADKDSL